MWHCSFIFVALLAAAVSAGPSAFATSTNVPGDVTIEGRLYDASSNPVNVNDAKIQFEVVDENNTSCVLYRETFYPVDVSSSDVNEQGVFSLRLGSGSADFTAAPLAQLFGPGGTWNGDSNGDNAADSCSVSAGAGSHRLIVTKVYNSSTTAWETLSPSTKLTSVPTALAAETAYTLQGLAATDFLQVKSDASYSLSQANLQYVFNSVNYPRLKDLVDGASSQYMVSNPGSSVSFNGQTLTNVAAPAAGTDATNKNYVDSYVGGKTVDVSGVSSTAGDGATLVWDQGANKWVTGTPVATDNTKLPLTGGIMQGAISMAGYDVLGTGHITMSPGKTITLGSFTDATEAALMGSLSAANTGASWYNTDHGVYKIWNGTAAVPQAYLGADSKLSSAWLPDTGVTAGNYGSSTMIPIFTVGADGRLTVAGSTAISGAPPNGAAGGDLSGNYPNPTIASNAVTTAKIINDAITPPKVNSSVATPMNQMLITNATGMGFDYATCLSPNQVMKWTGTEWACADVFTLAPVVSVAGKMGAVILNHADISDLGSAAVLDAGTAANQLVQLDGTAKLPAVDGSQLTDVDAAKIAGSAVAPASPASADVLTWNGTTKVWEPRTASVTGAFLNGGNHFGSVATLGTTDAYPLMLMTGNSSRLTIDPVGNVGVGTTTPSAPLHVVSGSAGALIVETNSGGINAPFIQLKDSRPSGHVWNLASGMNGLGQLNFYDATSASTRFTISATGQVGIGTTAPTETLQVAGNIKVSGTGNGIKFPDGTTQTTAALGGDFLSDGTKSMTGNLRLNGNFLSGDGGNEGIYVDGSGNVGVGTTAPGKLLDVNGAARATTIQTKSSGSASAPAYSYSGSALTGMFFPVSDTLAVSTAGVERLRIGGSGYVGIGTTSPSSTLDVNGVITSSLGGFRFPDGSSQTTAAFPGDSDQTIQFNNSGAFGGSSHLTWDYTNSKLTVDGTLRIVDGNQANGKVLTSDANGVASWQTPSGGGGSGDFLKDGTVAMTGNIQLNGHYLSGDGGNEGVFVDSSGNVGIGTTTPVQRLQISNGSLMINDPSGTSYAQMYLSGNHIYRLIGGAGPGNDLSLPTGAFAIYDGSMATTRFLIDDAGHVGIGTKTPRDTLDVNGTLVLKPAGNVSSTAVDFGTGNLQYTANNCGAFTLKNMHDGGSYAFVVKGTTSALCDFTAYSDAGTNGLTVHMPPDHSSTIAGKQTYYNFTVFGGDVYVAWTPGY